MSLSSKKAQLKLPGTPKPTTKYRADIILKYDKNVVVSRLTIDEINTLVKKNKNVIFDFSSSHFKIEKDSFLKQCRDNIKLCV